MENLDIAEKNNGLIIKNIKNFEAKHIFDCGQCFRWNEQEDGSYTGVAYNKVINVKSADNVLYIDNCNLKDFNDIWYKYFDLNRDYDHIKMKLRNDKILEKAIKFGYGVRILNQDPWETLISFIISANNGIPRIKKCIEALSESYGKKIGEYKGQTYYSFPEPEILKEMRIEELLKSGVGFRAKYIFNAAVIVGEKQMNIYRMKNLSTEDARKELMLFAGVGPKVSDCIMLFSMEKHDAFPIDVWVKRVMEYFYLPEGSKLKDIQEFAQDKFGAYAGFAQQYLFYYARELKLGKNN
ncbi:DNA-3-methyladenine glycosylase family protein [Abyssisolibacter fermentans]|uniref:DNA-3-methyladenine glycosylase family protein n=1 Tax=Abyssisolibacter fermentans TaxID=1766203 RepID=UPI000830DF4A|nr:DNA glycosylase [Abyssisolibacter fermentans]